MAPYAPTDAQQASGDQTLWYGPFPTRWWLCCMLLIVYLLLPVGFRIEAASTLASLYCSREAGACLVRRGLFSTGGTIDAHFDIRELETVEVAEGASARANPMVYLTLDDQGRYELTDTAADDTVDAIRAFLADPSQETLRVSHLGRTWVALSLFLVVLLVVSVRTFRRFFLAQRWTQVVVSRLHGTLQIDRPRLLRAAKRTIMPLPRVARIVVRSSGSTGRVAVWTIEGEEVPLVGVAMVGREEHDAFARRLSFAIWG